MGNEHPHELDEWTLFDFRPPPPDAEVQFWRRGVAHAPGNDQTWVGRSRDLHPAFNVYGVYWCAIPPQRMLD
jgi:hypothetical protein